MLLPAVCAILAGCLSDPYVNVVVETEKGVIIVAVDTVAAPGTAANFLSYVDAGMYEGGSFFRTVRMDNQPEDSIRIEIIQGGANPELREQFFEAVTLERTSQTGLLHSDGAISMARSSPDTGTHSFFFSIGDQPSLDFGGLRNPDGQGFAAFGHVVEGMEIVRDIQMGEAQGQSLLVPVDIFSITRQ